MLFFSIIQIVLSVIIVVVVLLQQRGNQTGIAFGGGGESFRSKRGLEKFLFYVTIVAAALFAANSILFLVYQ